jgi:hypothetical protein
LVSTMFGSFNPESLQAFYDSFDFADGNSCPEGEKPVFGVCRKVGAGSGEKDFDSSAKTEQEKSVEEAAKKAGSDVKSNKPFKDPKTGKLMGWAIKDGKPVAVEWGAVAGQKKVGTGKPEQKKKEKKKPQGQTAQIAQAASDAYIKGQESLLQDSRLNDEAKAAIQENIDKFKAKLGQ